MAESENNIKQVDVEGFKCPSCGGTMVFDPNTQSLNCGHCGRREQLKKDKSVEENDIAAGFEKADRVSKGEQVKYRCENCGAEVVLNADESANICPFCSASHIVSEGTFDGLKPQVVVPFQFGADKASGFARDWAKKRIFAPRKFKKNLKAENIHGVYEPCFTFDSNTHSTYVGRVGDVHTRTVGSGKNRRTETYVVYRNVRGTYDKFFDDVVVATNKNFNQNMLRSISPFNFREQCVYERKYLSGFVAESYQKGLKDSWQSAKKIIDDNLYSAIKSSLNCDKVDYLNISTAHSSVTYKYVLLPVWTTSYSYKNKRYSVLVNGSNGKVNGKTPVSPLRVAIAAVIVIALVALLAVFFLTDN